MKCSTGEAAGVVVATVRSRTPAAMAGLVAGDRILTVNGETVADAIDFQFHAADERLKHGASADAATAGGRGALRFLLVSASLGCAHDEESISVGGLFVGRVRRRRPAEYTNSSAESY